MRAVLYENPSTPDGWNRWAYHHRNSHDNIRAAILAQSGINLPDYPVDPMRDDLIDIFLQNNAQLHTDMNSTTGLQASDLLEVDFEDDAQRLAWIFAHAREHENVELQLGI